MNFITWLIKKIVGGIKEIWDEPVGKPFVLYVVTLICMFIVTPLLKETQYWIVPVVVIGGLAITTLASIVIHEYGYYKQEVQNDS